VEFPESHGQDLGGQVDIFKLKAGCFIESHTSHVQQPEQAKANRARECSRTPMQRHVQRFAEEALNFIGAIDIRLWATPVEWQQTLRWDLRIDIVNRPKLGELPDIRKPTRLTATVRRKHCPFKRQLPRDVPMSVLP
jgi:hypothetical protein